MDTEHRKTKISRQYIRNVYCAQTNKLLHQKCLVSTETQQFPDGTSEKFIENRNTTFPDGISEISIVHRQRKLSVGTSELCTEHRNTTNSRRYIINLYSAQKKNPFSLYIRNVYWTQKHNFKTVQQKCVLSTETQQFPDGTSEKCTENRNKTFSRRYIRKVYSAQAKNTFCRYIRNV